MRGTENGIVAGKLMSKISLIFLSKHSLYWSECCVIAYTVSKLIVVSHVGKSTKINRYRLVVGPNTDEAVAENSTLAPIDSIAKTTVT